MNIDIRDKIKLLKKQNYHRHSSYSNTSTPDCSVSNEDYAKRAKELGEGILSSVEHGFQGNYWETYLLAKKYGLKFIFGAEVYWVKDRFEKDRTNAHMIILAKNENGRKAINLAISEANDTGYFYKPRLDLELLLNLPPKDVFITTACLGFWHYEDIDDIVLKLHNHFKENMMLEVQYHYTDKQRKINSHILELSREYGIKIIMGCDSHYIKEEQAQEREYLLAFKGIRYDDENSWFMDYPTTLEAYDRFKRQGVLSDEEIYEAINNTNTLLDFEDIEFDKNIKLISLLPNHTQEEKDKYYKNIIMKEFKNYVTENQIPNTEWKRYQEGIKSEVKTVIDTGMADYFIFDYHAVKDGVANGGMITPTGRGSGVSFFTNTLLGFSNVDRFISPVTLYPERFMSVSRISDAVSLPDLDLNMGNVEVFVEAQEKLLGRDYIYPMIAYGTLKAKSAWKMYAGANNVDFETSNKISSQIDSYEEALKYADEDEKDDIKLSDYVDKKYHKLLEESSNYLGIISDKKKHACGYLLYDKNIREEIGLIKCKSENSKKEYLVALIDGKMADEFKFLKNDNLKVDVVKSNYLIAERIGIKLPTIRQLTNIVEGNEKIWNLYANGWTLGLNQVEKESTTKKVMSYKPTTVAELCCFIAAIRPSFKSMYRVFANRERFNYGIPSFDNIIQNEHIKDSFIFFQEQIMSALAFGGIAISDTYTLVKAISKKKHKIINQFKDDFLHGFKEKVMDLEGKTEEEALIIANKVWQIINDAAAYGFNASHSLCVSYDSLYGAYYKAYYPYEFYEIMLNLYAEKGKNDKVALFKQEMYSYANIKEGKLKFRADNRRFTIDRENECIHPSLKGIKGIGQKDAEQLYELKDNTYENFIEMYHDLKTKTVINTGKIETLILLDYFSEFGKRDKLLKMKKIYEDLYDKKQIKKDKLKDLGLTENIVAKYSKKETEKLFKDIDMLGLINELTNKLEDKDINIFDIVQAEIDYLGYITYKNENIKNYYYVYKIDTYKNKTSITYYLNVYNIEKGINERVKIKDYEGFSMYPIKEGDFIKAEDSSLEPKKQEIDVKKKDGTMGKKWVSIPNEFWKIIIEWSVAKNGK